MNNAEDQFAVWARAQGWTVGKRGWPDFLCRRGPELMGVEVKDGNDWLSNEQRACLIDLNSYGIPTFIWSPIEGLMQYPPGPVVSPLETYQLQQRITEQERELGELRSAMQILRTTVGNRSAAIENQKREWRTQARRWKAYIRFLLAIIGRYGHQVPSEIELIRNTLTAPVELPEPLVA